MVQIFNEDLYSVYYNAMKIKSFAYGIILLFLVSCTYREPVYTGQEIITNNIDKISIIPFRYINGAGRAVISDKFMADFNKELYSRLSAGLIGVKVTGPEISFKAMDTIKLNPDNIGYIPEFCRRTGCDAVLTGEIKEYGERVGGEYGVENPASFGFTAKLHDGKTGNIIWEDYYYEKQIPLTENVVEVGKFIKRKGKWISAQEIANEGIDELVNKLNVLLK